MQKNKILTWIWNFVILLLAFLGCILLLVLAVLPFEETKREHDDPM